MYISHLFKSALTYAQSLKPDKIFILSAKYGLVALDERIEPYEKTLNTMHSSEVRDCPKRALASLSHHF